MDVFFSIIIYLSFCRLESFLPSDETLRERKQEWEHLFSVSC